jgi:hypothetical protein
LLAAPISTLFKVDSVNLAISVVKPDKLRVTYGDVGRSWHAEARAFWVLKRQFTALTQSQGGTCLSNASPHRGHSQAERSPSHDKGCAAILHALLAGINSQPSTANTT